MSRFKDKLLYIIMATIIVSSFCITKDVIAISPIKLIVDGKDITALSSPIIEQDRVLVPIRFISEELGATVIWNNENRTVFVEKEDSSVLLRIGSHLVEYNNGMDYDLSDVAPKIFNDRTYVPLRLISNALGIGIEWINDSRTVDIDSSKPSQSTSFFDLDILSQNAGQTIVGKTNLQLGASQIYTKNENKVKYLLLDPISTKGFIVASGDQVAGSYTYLPNISDNGKRVLVAAIYDKDDKFIAGDAIAISISVNPRVELTGIDEGHTMLNSTSLGANINFVASYIKYEITNLDTGKVLLTNEQDPLGTYNWNPMLKDNGNYSIRVIAYDKDSNSYSSNPVNVAVSLNRYLTLGGVKAGSIINKPVNLIANRNFDVSDTEYLMRDVKNGNITTIAKIPYGSYKWYPAPEDSGEKELFTRVISSGVIYDSAPIRVSVDGTPKLLLEGIGPNQVITGQTKIKVSSNISMDSVSYILTSSNTGKRRELAKNLMPQEEFLYTPLSSDEGNLTIQAEGIYGGKKIKSEPIGFRVYLGEIYGPKPVIEKSKFLDLASRLAKESYKKTGMSAALQTAQAILETGWGQSVPVDKYTGVLSNNLFGIKGNGPAGAVISNTWEVYNGVTYRVDAEFRAYNKVDNSWDDHKEFLLNRDRYASFKEVMYDYTQGAWALKRAGYATDPVYPIKLMNLIKQYNLYELDKVGI